MIPLWLVMVPAGRASEPEAPSADPPAEETVVVEASREGASPAERSLDADDIEAAGATDVAMALVDEVRVTVRSGSRGEHLFTLDGFDQRQVAVFVDGVPASVPYDGQLDLGKLGSGMVESIIVTPGAAAGLYGPAGLGGAVRVRTWRAPSAPTAWARVATTAEGGADALAWGGGPVGALRVGVGLGARSSPGWPLPSDWMASEDEDGGLRDASAYRAQEGHLRAEWRLGGGTLRGVANALSGSFDVPTAIDQDKARYWRFSEFTDAGASLGWSSARGAAFEGDITTFAAAEGNVLDAFDDATRTTQDSPAGWTSTYDDHRLGGVGSVALHLGPGVTARAWLFADHQQHRSQDDAGEPWEEVGTTLTSGALALDARRGGWSGFAGAELDGEVPNEGGDFEAAPVSLGPSVGCGYTDARLALTAGVARRARAPSLKERFSSAFGDRLANLELGPEHAWEGSVDARWRALGPLTLSASVHDAEVSDLIEEVVVEPGLSQLQNVGRARFLGAELGARASLRWLDASASGGVLSATRTDAAPPQDRLEYRPPWQVNAEAQVRPGGGIEIGASVDVLGPQWVYDDDTLTWDRLGVGARVDASASWQETPALRLRLNVRNAPDATLWSAPGFPDPGRELRLELQVGDRPT